MQDRFAMNERQTQAPRPLHAFTLRSFRTARDGSRSPPCTSSITRNAAIAGRQARRAAAWRSRRRLDPVMRRYHDPSRYRIVLFDQRGCGRSTPHASSRRTPPGISSTTSSSCASISGSSAGRCSAAHGARRSRSLTPRPTPSGRPSSCCAASSRSRRAELEWFYQEGCSWIFPEAFEDYLRPIPAPERGDLISAYHRRLTHPDPDVQLEAARAWSAWEGKTLSLLPDAERVRRFSEDALRARLRAHRMPLLHAWRLLRRRRSVDRRSASAARTSPA